MSFVTLSLIIFGVSLNAGAQIFLKKGLLMTNGFTLTLQSALKVFLNAYVLAGLFCYGISIIIWLMVLSKTQVSVAYPLLSIGYIVSALGGYYFLGEVISLERLAGIVVIMIGVYLVAKSAA